MSGQHFSLNRPAHLARRNAYYEKAAELLYQPLTNRPSDERLTRLRLIARLLKTAFNHARFAVMAPAATDTDRDFLEFIDLLRRNLSAIIFMTEHESFLTTEESFLCRFLQADANACELPARHYRRRTDDLMEGLLHLLRLAQTPFFDLQQSAREGMTEEEHTRYQRALDSFRGEVHQDRTDGPDDASGADSA